MEPELISAILKSGPIGVAILAAGFSLWKWILPMLRELRQMDRDAEAQREAAQRAAEAQRETAQRESEAAREAARAARDGTWQATQREIAASNQVTQREIAQANKENLATVTVGFKDALDRNAVQYQALAADVSTVKTDVASMRSDLHAAVARLITLDGIPVVSTPRKE